MNLRATPKEQKKIYHPPKLTKYGTIRELTKSAGAMGNLDGGDMLGMRKTGTWGG